MKKNDRSTDRVPIPISRRHTRLPVPIRKGPARGEASTKAADVEENPHGGPARTEECVDSQGAVREGDDGVQGVSYAPHVRVVTLSEKAVSRKLEKKKKRRRARAVMNERGRRVQCLF